MDNNKPATPLPWRVIEARGSRPAIFINGPLKDGSPGPNSHSIAKLYNLMGWQDDAAYIVLACNAYPRLVDALEKLVMAEEEYGDDQNAAINEAWAPARMLLESLRVQP